MKKIIALILACLMLCTMLASCANSSTDGGNINKLPMGEIQTDIIGGDKPNNDQKPVDTQDTDDGDGDPDDTTHQHVFDEYPTEAMLKTPATCELGTTYYKSCECGEKSEETFTLTDLADHTFAEEWSSNANGHWHAATCNHSDEKKDVAKHDLNEANGVCWTCGFDTVVDSIGFETLKADGQSVSAKVSNKTESFDFSNEIAVGGNATYFLAYDETGGTLLENPLVDLEIGDNVFYLHATIEGERVIYTITIRRKPIYTVAFDSNGGHEVVAQYVEEGDLAKEPTTSRWGFVFGGWDHDFAEPITSNTTVTAQWSVDPRQTVETVSGMTPAQLFAVTKNILDAYTNFTLRNEQVQTIFVMGQEMGGASYTSIEMIDGDAGAVLAWNEEGTLVVDKRYVVDPSDETNNTYYYYDNDANLALRGTWKARLTLDEYYRLAGVDAEESRLLGIPESALTDIQFYVDEDNDLYYIECWVAGEVYQAKNPNLAGLDMSRDVAYRLYFNEDGEFQNLSVSVEAMTEVMSGGQKLTVEYFIELTGVFEEIDTTEVVAPDNPDAYPDRTGMIQIPN